MGLETLIPEKGDRLATMTLNRPERDDDTRVLVVKSNGKNFCTGYDLTEGGFLWGSGEPSRPEGSRPHRRAPIFSRREFHDGWRRPWCEIHTLGL